MTELSRLGLTRLATTSDTTALTTGDRAAWSLVAVGTCIQSKELSMTHELKTWPEYFEAIASGAKTFEIRNNDRNFREGDTVVLEEYCDNAYTGRAIVRVVNYITDFKQAEGYVVLGLKKK